MELLTLDEAAAECRVSRRTLERDHRQGRLAIVKIRRSSLVTRKELERYKLAVTRRAA